MDKLVCVYFKSTADADKLKEILDGLGIHATCVETVSTKYAENMSYLLSKAHELILQAHDTTKEHGK